MIEFFRKLNYRLFGRFLLVSNIAAGINIGLDAILLKVWDVHYLIPSGVAFLVGVTSGFLMQKFWTFGDRQVNTIHWQYSYFLVIAMLSLMVHLGIVYIVVEFILLVEILAQIIGNFAVGIIKFIFYRFYLFAHMHRALEEHGIPTGQRGELGGKKQ